MAQGRDLTWVFDHVRRYETDPVGHDWDSSTNGGDVIVPTAAAGHRARRRTVKRAPIARSLP